MINIYFFPTRQNTLSIEAERVIRGAKLWEGKPCEDYLAVVTQTGKSDSNIYIGVNDYEEIRSAIAHNHSQLASHLMRKLVELWTNDKVLLVLPYAAKGVTFVTASTMERGDRYDGYGHMVMMAIKIEDPTTYIEWLRQINVRVLSPDIVLFCDVGLSYEPNIFRGTTPYYLDYSTASINQKMSFMHELYASDEHWSRDEEREYNEYNPNKNKMAFYNYSLEQARNMIYSGSQMSMIKKYTLKEVSAILEMRAVNTPADVGETTKLTAEEGQALYLKRVELDSKDGGFKDLVYPVHEIVRTMRLAITARRDGYEQPLYVPITEMTVEEYLHRKRMFVEAKNNTNDLVGLIAMLIEYHPALFKSNFKYTTDVEWTVELEEVISKSNEENVTVTTLEIL